MVDRLPIRLLRRHIVRRPRNHARISQTRIIRRPRKSKIRQIRPLYIVLEQDIRRLHIAMHETLRMRRCQARRGLQTNPQNLRNA